jgi:hypothetical protein
MSIVVAFLLASAGTAQEQPAPAPAAATAPAPAKPAKEKKICKADPDSDPASHMIKRTCKTAAEWQNQGVLGSSRSGFSVSGDRMDQGSH